MARTMSSSSHRFLFFSFEFVLFAGLVCVGLGDVGATGVVGVAGADVVSVSFGVDGVV